MDVCDDDDDNDDDDGGDGDDDDDYDDVDNVDDVDDVDYVDDVDFVVDVVVDVVVGVAVVVDDDGGDEVKLGDVKVEVDSSFLRRKAPGGSGKTKNPTQWFGWRTNGLVRHDPLIPCWIFRGNFAATFDPFTGDYVYKRGGGEIEKLNYTESWRRRCASPNWAQHWSKEV